MEAKSSLLLSGWTEFKRNIGHELKKKYKAQAMIGHTPLIYLF